MTWINFFELRNAARFQIVATGAKLFACSLIIVTGLYFWMFKGAYKAECGRVLSVRLFEGWNESLEEPMKRSNYDVGSLFTSLYGGLYAYSGWDILNMRSESAHKLAVCSPTTVNMRPHFSSKFLSLKQRQNYVFSCGEIKNQRRSAIFYRNI